MNKILLIIKREYLSRVKKKSFILMTILGPILMATVMIAPVFFATVSDESKKVGIVDESGFFVEAFENTKDVSFETLHLNIEQAKTMMDTLGLDIILYIPQPAYTYPSNVVLYSRKQPGMIVESYIRNSINDDLRTLRMTEAGVAKDVIDKIKTSIDVNTIKINDQGHEEESMAMRDYLLGFVVALVIYFFIFMFGAQVMRGVIEEKTSRIVEVIISSVKPFQLMMGKIIGIAMVGLTQFVLWVLLTLVIVTAAQQSFSKELMAIKKTEINQVGNAVNTQELNSQIEQNDSMEMLKAISTINFPIIIFSFIFYFLFGYLMYASLFAAVGGAVDSETDTQQFMLPITAPMIFSIIMAQMVANNPDGPLAFWLSIIPLTSPILMMVRIPYGVPWPELALSMAMLILGFVFTTWIAAKIYRTGILMYGKKPTYKDIWKWIRYKN